MSLFQWLVTLGDIFFIGWVYQEIKDMRRFRIRARRELDILSKSYWDQVEEVCDLEEKVKK